MRSYIVLLFLICYINGFSTELLNIKKKNYNNITILTQSSFDCEELSKIDIIGRKIAEFSNNNNINEPIYIIYYISRYPDDYNSDWGVKYTKDIKWYKSIKKESLQIFITVKNLINIYDNIIIIEHIIKNPNYFKGDMFNQLKFHVQDTVLKYPNLYTPFDDGKYYNENGLQCYKYNKRPFRTKDGTIVRNKRDINYYYQSGKYFFYKENIDSVLLVLDNIFSIEKINDLYIFLESYNKFYLIDTNDELYLCLSNKTYKLIGPFYLKEKYIYSFSIKALNEEVFEIFVSSSGSAYRYYLLLNENTLIKTKTEYIIYY